MKQGLANAAPFLCARQVAVTLQALAFVDRKYTLPYPPVHSSTAWAEWALISPERRSRTVMPAARPSCTTTSSISMRL